MSDNSITIEKDLNDVMNKEDEDKEGGEQDEYGEGDDDEKENGAEGEDEDEMYAELDDGNIGNDGDDEDDEYEYGKDDNNENEHESEEGRDNKDEPKGSESDKGVQSETAKKSRVCVRETETGSRKMTPKLKQNVATVITDCHTWSFGLIQDDPPEDSSQTSLSNKNSQQRIIVEALHTQEHQSDFFSSQEN
ncbi:glutamic acid-rich protein-like [Papaver somniferum]|uniref:glutamic acid-rich protein-like n=1 Tax=Papaver somniferum TaxID=3469 RepID=UPI000E6FA372|nr:glutamic acid-rich protein-like [Papaver somniferum]